MTLPLIIVCIACLLVLKEVKASPTMPPTVSPTQSPTVSDFPTESPTISHQPTASPTDSPTHIPTFAPSMTPTFAPSLVPTFTPTAVPTFSPSSDPTLTPTLSPTAVPTFSPTFAPSTARPTAAPTVSPTLDPTGNPTFTPSNLPTELPTASPTADPTMQPTAPTVAPTESPTELIVEYSKPQYYTVDTSQAYSWNYAYPQSCECVENGVLKSDCEIFKCLCACDINAGQCDYNCCCDPDCSTDQVTRFLSLGSCLYEGHSASSVEFCYSSVELYGINPKEPMGGQTTSQEALGKALCVVKTNYVMKEDYYTNAELVTSDLFKQDEGTKKYDYIEDSYDVVLPDSNYDQNDTIAAFLNISNTLVNNGIGYFQLPIGDTNGECNDYNYITFENNIYSTTPQICSRVLSKDYNIFTSQCNHDYSVGKYVTDLWIATAANTQASSGTADFNDVINVQLTQVIFEDYITTIQYDITNDWITKNCKTHTASYTDFIANNDGCANSLSQYTSLFASSGYLCVGMIKSVDYTVTHTTTTTATITSVTAKIIITDAPMLSIDASLQDTTNVRIQQSYSVQFFSENVNGQTATNGNLVNRQRSGNPGYMMGLPILYGYDSGSNTINELIDGLSIPSPITNYDINNNKDIFGQSICPQRSSDNNENDNIGKSQIHFGYDISTGCSLKLNRTALMNLCCQGATSCTSNNIPTGYSPYSNDNGIPIFLDFTPGYVGIYGDADPLDKDNQWFPITYTIPESTRTWNFKTSTCSHMFTGLNIEFLIARSGEKSNPQNKIISALAEVVTSDIVMNVPYKDDTTTQTIPLTVTVSFVFRDNNVVTSYETPPPPVLFEVPYDVFYPFLSSEDTNSNAASSHRQLSGRSNYLSLWFVMTIIGTIYLAIMKQR